jgi:hypothetical protein
MTTSGKALHGVAKDLLGIADLLILLARRMGL